ncbi:MAG: cytochrome c biogenesis protein CcsA [Candidatus Protistobacter heckmanni]|nr:cytochrome c biogenesis protein CcsA [Candidatus Protistobacter heckmanni]
MESAAQPILYALTAGLYGGLALRDWMGGKAGRPVADAVAGAFTQTPSGDGSSGAANPQAQGGLRHILLFAALVCHGLLLHETVFGAQTMVFGFAYALSTMIWLGAVTYWFESLVLPLAGLRLLLLPAALAASLLPLAFAGSRVLANPASTLFKLHFIIANMAYGRLALAASHALLMLLVEQRLHLMGRAQPRTGLMFRLGAWLDGMPPLLTLERLLFRLIGVGFALLTVTMISGLFFSEALFGKALRFEHKTVFAVISWLMFGGILLGRALRGWRGRAALRWVLASFALLLLAYVGTRFVLEVLLNKV